jgi:hypothetical protein
MFYGFVKRQYVLTVARILPSERQLSVGMAAASAYVLFGISTRLITDPCLEKAKQVSSYAA